MTTIPRKVFIQVDSTEEQVYYCYCIEHSFLGYNVVYR